MKLLNVALASLLMSGGLSAQDIKIIGTLLHTAKIPAAQGKHNAQITAKQTREIKLLKVELSDKAKQHFTAKASHSLAHTGQFAANAASKFGRFPSKIQLGMNDVPVLDQGQHGTCVTFATTAALDAALGQGDYVSQLCSLQLGNYLATNGYQSSGWDGTWGPALLSQIDSFGIVNKTTETTIGCGNLTSYPMTGDAPESFMTVEQYHKISESLEEKVIWSPILSTYQAVLDRFDTNKTLADVKQALNSGDRVTFGVLLLDFDLGSVGAVGKTGSEYDSWVLTPEIARDVYLRPEFGGHEMVITGYDDDAIATDDEGRTYQGLLTLRNSWGEDMGKKGDFYMSYEYFKLLVLEAQRIRSAENIAF
jgi:hypothetical protein